MRLFLCVFFFLSFTHSSSHVLHDFELSSSSSFKSKFCLVRPFSFHQEHVRTSNVEKRLQKKKKKKIKKKKKNKKKKKKKKKKKEVEERKRVNQRTLLFPNQV